MTTPQFKKVFAVADDATVELHEVDMSILHGCGLPGFQRVSVTKKVAAALLRWQAMNIGHPKVRDDLKWNWDEVNSMKEIFRRKVDLLD